MVFTPIELEAPYQVWSEPVKWYALIKRMEKLRELNGMGLAHTWDLVNEGDYEAARWSFEQTMRDWRSSVL